MLGGGGSCLILRGVRRTDYVWFGEIGVCFGVSKNVQLYILVLALRP